MTLLGALVAFFSLGITVFGWYKTTRLQVDGQRELLRLKLLNEARYEIRQVLRQEDDRLGECSVGLHVLRFSDPVTPKICAQVATTLRTAAMHPGATNWLFVLEANAALFPELRVARIQLGQRQMKLHEEFRSYADLLLHAALPLPRYLEAALEELWNNITDQSALLGDILIHVQNQALAPVSGYATPARQPPDDRVPRLIMDDGDLVISVPEKARRVEMEVANWLPPRNPPGAYAG